MTKRSAEVSERGASARDELGVSAKASATTGSATKRGSIIPGAVAARPNVSSGVDKFITEATGAETGTISAAANWVAISCDAGPATAAEATSTGADALTANPGAETSWVIVTALATGAKTTGAEGAEGSKVERPSIGTGTRSVVKANARAAAAAAKPP